MLRTSAKVSSKITGASGCLFILMITITLESVIPDKCPSRDMQAKRKFCIYGVGIIRICSESVDGDEEDPGVPWDPACEVVNLDKVLKKCEIDVLKGIDSLRG